MTTIKSLKDMYVKLGGSLTDTYADIAGGKAVGTYATIPEMIQACTKKAGSGGGGDAEPFYVKFTITNQETFEIGSADKTFAEVAAADAAGKRIVGKFVVTVEGQEVEVLEAEVAIKTVLEHGNAYVWQYIDEETLKSVYYDAEGISSSVSTWAEINGPLIVEMTAGETDGTFVSTTTYGEAFSAIQAGKTVMFKIADLGFTNVVSALSMGESVSFLFVANTESSITQGASTDTISISMS